MSTAAQARPGRGSRKSSVIDYVALAGVQSLGDEGIARILAQVRQDGGTIEDLYSATTKRLQDHYGLRSAAAQIVRDRSEQLRERAAQLIERADALGVVVLAPADAAYPARLDAFYEGEPPVLYARGNLALLDVPGVAVLNSAKPTAESLEYVLALASRLAEAGQTLVVGTESPSYNVVGLAAKRAGGSAIIVLHDGLLTALEHRPDREPMPLARFAGEQLDPRHTLVVSPFRLDGR